ncbi:MAG: GC-type dockerin domain-anchored protein [Planctomycetota bacterium]
MLPDSDARRGRFLAGLAGLAMTCAAASAQPSPLHQYDMPIGIDSGPLALPGLPADEHQVIYSATVAAPGAVWTRVSFGEVDLADDAIIRITSLEDGFDQHLNATTLRQWRSTSAYFNGDTLLVEVLARPGGGVSRMEISKLVAGDGFGAGAFDSICGPTDDRELSDDPRNARLMPVGCTAWLIDDCAKCFLTAGHCTFSATVVQFNVPLSSSSGSTRNPDPEDQYPVDPASMQSNGGLGIGNDWAYFGTFANSETGLTAAEAQGATYILADEAPSSTGDIRITGYGSTRGTGAPLEWSQVQKTHTGPFVAKSGFGLSYQTDTTGGNSGSPVIDETTGMAIGIHTHAGCSATSGNNGTAVDRPELQDALENPQGVCCPPLTGIEIAAPDLDLIPPGEPFEFAVTITEVDGTLDPDSAELVFDMGGGFESVPLVALGGDQFSATLPAMSCGDTVPYYIRATSDGEEATAPLGAPTTGTYDAIAATARLNIASFDFESGAGWTVQDTALSTGSWDRGVPGPFGRGAPSADFDGSGSAYVTGNSVDEDVDGGPTVLTSPIIDLSGAPDNAVLSYARWFSNDDGDDVLTVEISDDAGATWTRIESTGDEAFWRVVRVPISDFASLTNQVQLRFTTSDNPNDSVTEAAIDAISIDGLACGDCRADIDGDGDLTVFDFLAFQNLFNAGDLAADFDGDGALTIFDFLMFQSEFDAGCP